MALTPAHRRGTHDRSGLLRAHRLAAAVPELTGAVVICAGNHIPYIEQSAKAADSPGYTDRFGLAALTGKSNRNARTHWKRDKAAKTALNAGDRKVRGQRSGISEWKAKERRAE